MGKYFPGLQTGLSGCKVAKMPPVVAFWAYWLRNYKRVWGKSDILLSYSFHSAWQWWMGAKSVVWVSCSFHSEWKWRMGAHGLTLWLQEVCFLQCASFGGPYPPPLKAGFSIWVLIKNLLEQSFSLVKFWAKKMKNWRRTGMLSAGSQFGADGQQLCSL